MFDFLSSYGEAEGRFVGGFGEGLKAIFEFFDRRVVAEVTIYLLAELFLANVRRSKYIDLVSSFSSCDVRNANPFFL